MSEATTLRVRECRCPETPHLEGDTVTFPPRLGLDAGLAVTFAIQHSSDESELEVKLGRALFIWGPSGWNLLDDKGKPRDFDRKLLEQEFPWEDGGLEIAEQANSMYSAAALDPLFRRQIALSRNGQTATSRSPTRKTKRGTPPPSASSSDEPSVSPV